MTTTETPLLIDETYKCESLVVDRELVKYAHGRGDHLWCRVCRRELFSGDSALVLKRKKIHRGEEIWKRWGVFCSVACQRRAHFDTLVARKGNHGELRQIRKEFRQILSLERRAIGYSLPRLNFGDEDEEE